MFPGPPAQPKKTKSQFQFPHRCDIYFIRYDISAASILFHPNTHRETTEPLHQRTLVAQARLLSKKDPSIDWMGCSPAHITDAYTVSLPEARSLVRQAGSCTVFHIIQHAACIAVSTMR